jgi:hypothetical protein
MKGREIKRSWWWWVVESCVTRGGVLVVRGIGVQWCCGGGECALGRKGDGCIATTIFGWEKIKIDWEDLR